MNCFKEVLVGRGTAVRLTTNYGFPTPFILVTSLVPPFCHKCFIVIGPNGKADVQISGLHSKKTTKDKEFRVHKFYSSKHFDKRKFRNGGYEISWFGTWFGTYHIH